MDRAPDYESDGCAFDSRRGRLSGYTYPMPKVLHLIDHNGLGGAQRIVAGILAKRSSDLVFPLRSHPNPMFALPEDYPLVGSPNPKPGLILKIKPLRMWLKAYPADILHCHLQASWLLGIFLSRFNNRDRRLHFIFHEHNPYILYSQTYPYLVKLAARSGKIIVVSGSLRQRLRKLDIPEEKQIYLPNYVASQFFTNQNGAARLEPDPGWCGNKTIVGYAGRIVGIKGWRTLVEVAQALREEAVVFLVAGTGADEKQLRQSIQTNNLGDKIRLLGFVEDMGSFYHSIDLLLFPSWYEVFGLAPLEAQACGTVVVASDIPGIKEVIDEHNAILLPPGDIAGMVKAIQDLIAHPELRQTLVERGYKNARKYAIEGYLSQLEQIYRSVMVD